MRNRVAHRRSSSTPVMRVATVAAAIAIVTAAPPALSRAEIPVGEPIPEFTLERLDDGSQVSAHRDGERLTLEIAGEPLTPSATILHFFQPDCLQCQVQMEALQTIHEDFADRGVVVVGVAHRGEREDVNAVADRLGVSYPLVIGVGSDIAKRLAGGDAMAILDSAGVARFAQVGYRPPHESQPGDEALWRENISRLLSGRPVEQATVERSRLQAGDVLPAIRLSDVFTGRTMVLAGEDGRLTFRDQDGEVTRPAAAIGLFSRYCAFTREEMKFLQELSERYEDQGLFVFAIAMTPSREETPSITRELGVTYPVFYGKGSELGDRYAYGCPAYIVDASGVIRYTQVGFEKEDEKKYEAVIKELLDGDK